MFKNTIASLSILAILSGCNGSGSVSTSTVYSSPDITASQFVSALNDVDGRPIYDESEIELYVGETIRSTYAGEDDWFVIWDAEMSEYKAVSLQYVRALTYYDYAQSNYGTADSFRDDEADDILDGYVNGDFWGDNYETVDYLGTDIFGIPTFEGQVTGFLYEDEEDTKDVSLLAGEADMRAKAQKASNISFLYQVDMKTSLALVSLGEKVEKKLGASAGEITAQDQADLMKDITHLTGVTADDLTDIALGNKNKDQMLDKVAKKIGTSATTLEQKMLPELFGIDL